MGRRRQTNTTTTTPVPTNTAEVKRLVSTPDGGSLYDQLGYIRTVNTSNDTFTGNDGGNHITSYGGRDTINAGGGNDVITTSGGTAIIDGGTGLDQASVDISHKTAAITVTGDIGSGKTAVFSDGTVIANVEGLFLRLGAGDDIISFNGGGLGGSGFSFQGLAISGGAGNDRITVQQGNGHQLIGGAGNDILTGGTGNDWLIGNEDADILVAGLGNDRLEGGSGNDRLDAGAGSDTLYGGAGVDILSGGADADFFGFSAGGLSRILDFNFAEGDRILNQFQFFDPESVDGSQPDTVAAARVTDPIASGFVTATQTAEGLLLGLVGDPGSGLLLVGVSLSDFNNGWFVG